MNICVFISTLSSFTLCILKEIPWICSPTAFVNLTELQSSDHEFPSSSFTGRICRSQQEQESLSLNDLRLLCFEKKRRYRRWGLYHACDVLFCSSQPQEGWTEGCARQPFSMSALISSRDQPDSKGQLAQILLCDMCVMLSWQQSWRAPTCLSYTQKSKLKLWKREGGCPTPSEQQMQKQKSLCGDISLTSVRGHLGTYLWHSFHPSADTTPCARCPAKGCFATRSRNISLLQQTPVTPHLATSPEPTPEGQEAALGPSYLSRAVSPSPVPSSPPGSLQPARWRPWTETGARCSQSSCHWCRWAHRSSTRTTLSGGSRLHVETRNHRFSKRISLEG